MIYLVIGILGIAVFKKDTVIELLEIATAYVLAGLDAVWTKIFG